MNSNLMAARSAFAAAALGLAAGTAPAAVTVYTTSASFSAAATQVFNDTFNNLAPDFAASPLTRVNGPYSYTISSPGGLYGAGSDADAWLSTNLSGNSLTFDGFTGGVRGLGGLFFGSDLAGAFLAGQTLTLTATDSVGASITHTLSGATTASFVGFVSNALLVSVVVGIESQGAWTTVNNLALSQAPGLPIPEPETYALLLAGLAVVAGVARRRSRD